MVFFDSIDALVRAAREGRIAAGERAYVPLAMRRAAPPAAWDALRAALDAASVRTTVSPTLRRICVLLPDELRQGMAPRDGQSLEGD